MLRFRLRVDGFMSILTHGREWKLEEDWQKSARPPKIWDQNGALFPWAKASHMVKAKVKDRRSACREVISKEEREVTISDRKYHVR